MGESWHIPRTLSYEALRLLTALPVSEIERRLRIEPAAVEGQPGDQEAGQLAEWLYHLAAERTCNRRRGIRPHPSALTRAAVLLEQLSASQPLRPIPVSERLPLPEDCDEQGRCWFYTSASVVTDAFWVLRKPDHQRLWDAHWLPASALPVPESQP